MTPTLREIEQMTLKELEPMAKASLERIKACRSALKRHFVGKDEIVDLMFLCALAQEPLLLVGPPGTAKSDLVVKFRDALGIAESDYFEYMLTRFTEPSEIMGPVDIQELQAGKYRRRVDGRLPTARMVFLDEVFRANSAILNSLLTMVNEKKFYQDGRPEPVALKILFAAANIIPDDEELGALKDRFTLKVACLPVQNTHFLPLLKSALASGASREAKLTPWAEGLATLEDLMIGARYMSLLLGHVTSGRNESLTDIERYFPPEMMQEFRRIIQAVAADHNIITSDRKIVKLYRLIRTQAWLTTGGVVDRSALNVLKYIGETEEEISLLAEQVPKLLGNK